MKIYLKYGYYDGTTFLWAEPQNYDAVFVRGILETERIQGRTKRGCEYNHYLSHRKSYTITISSDELTSGTKLDYLTSFYAANGNRWQLSFDNWATSGDYTLKEAGPIPLTYIEDSEAFPEITFTLIQTEPY